MDLERNIKLKEQIDDYLRKYKEKLVFAATNGKSVIIDFNELDKYDDKLAEDLLEKPQEIIKEFNEGVKEFGLEVEVELQFKNLPKSQEERIRNLRTRHMEKFLCVEGMVKVASEVKPRIYETLHECQECGEKFSLEQRGSTIVKPYLCPTCKRRTSFKLLEKKMYDSRWVTIQEPFEITEGEKPGEIKVFLKKDLTTPEMQRKTDPGNRIILNGILKELSRQVRGIESTQTDIYLEANYIELTEQELEEINISKEDEQKIIELSKQKDIFDKLVDSLAPSIYGNREIKEAILLQIFGGTHADLPDGSHIRGDIHLLIVGDPATAKSQLLKLVSKFIPRSKYVSGKGVTGAGLISTVRKDEFTGGWVLEAGALVLCNKGLLAIDEFEKMDKEDMVAMHEALEQGTVSIAKATIIATLPAQTSVLAGANPKLGRFDVYTPIAEQIMIPPTLLSRFDLKFALRDVPDVDADKKLVDHVLKARLDINSIEPEIPHSFIKKYIAYSKQHVKEVILTEDTLKVFKNFFIDMRSKFTEEDRIVPITFRQFEALIRLAQGSAKVNLRTETIKEDADRAIRIMQISLRQLGFDAETNKLDIDRMENSVAGTQRSKIRILLDIIDKLEKDSKEVSMEDIEALAEEEGLGEVRDMVQKLEREGVLYKPKPGFIRKV
ncbi:MAG: minichromosome maintenance protein MCM [Candidatus Aenigmarchaeota archaeon]|nr:minichromosome maintenance protein MCM [Candidatus Aenigmarchaeota archaeon]